MNQWTVKQVMGLSLLLAVLLSFVPLPISIRQWWPEWILLIIIFWSIHQPQLFSVWSAFMLGLVVDAITDSTLAMNAIPYAVVVYFARLWGQNYALWTLFEQYFLVITLLMIATLIHLFLLLFSSLVAVPYSLYIQMILSSLLVWPLMQWSLTQQQKHF